CPARAWWPWWAQARRGWRPHASCSAKATPSRSSSVRTAWAVPGPTTREPTKRIRWAPPSMAACTRRCARTSRASSWASRATRASWAGSSPGTRARSRATRRCSPSCARSPRSPVHFQQSGYVPRCCARRHPSVVAGKAVRGGAWRGGARTARWPWRPSTPSSSATGTAPCPSCPSSQQCSFLRCRNRQVARKANARHNYRISEPFRDQIVVVVGLGASGIDIAREISQVTKEVHIASRYRYHFPFLDLDELTVDDENRVGPLYKHVFPPKYAPNLSFVGLPVKTILFQSFELEAKWVARVLSGRAALPSEEGMLAAVREHYRRMEESGRPRRHTHALMPEWVSSGF
uniref:Flavin-containing monooxygenase n=1 Tax=Aegilops tauschii subsp. strangulata TaxID=200361 RepID=A0A452YU69_AEGTS